MFEFCPVRNVRASLRSAAVSMLLATGLFAAAPAARAQNPTEEAPAYVAVADGDVTLDRDLDADAADVGMPVVPGDRLRTGRGRASLFFPDGSALDIDEYSTVDLHGERLVRLTEGRLRIAMPRASHARFEIDTHAGRVRIDAPGEYRIAVLGTAYAQTELAVVRGAAELAGTRDWVRVSAGERSIVWSDDQPGRPERYNVARLDAFDRWSDEQRAGRTAGNSERYLPADLRAYGADFDRDGTWQYETAYGYVWYPTVAATWLPYSSGYWAPVPRYGWTWIGAERWAWPTHHYGRWGYGNSRWFWIPDRRWGPAWVSWGTAPGYVGWCPLGWDNRPVFQLSVSLGTGWSGWSVSAYDRFGFEGHATIVSGANGWPRGLRANVGRLAYGAPPPLPARGLVVRGTARRSRDRGYGDRTAAVSGRRTDTSIGPGFRGDGTTRDRGVGSRDARTSAVERGDRAPHSQPPSATTPSALGVPRRAHEPPRAPHGRYAPGDVRRRAPNPAAENETRPGPSEGRPRRRAQQDNAGTRPSQPPTPIDMPPPRPSGSAVPARPGASSEGPVTPTRRSESGAPPGVAGGPRAREGGHVAQPRSSPGPTRGGDSGGRASRGVSPRGAGGGARVHAPGSRAPR